MSKKSTKKKPPVLIIAVVLLALLGGGYYFSSQKGPDVSNPTGGVDTKDGGTFSSISDALKRSMSLSCEYTDELGSETKTYIKNGAVRISSTGADGVEPGEVIVKDNKMYTWSPETLEGFVIEMEDADTDEMADDMVEVKSQESKSDFIGAIEAYKEHCRVSTVSDSYFDPPTDVEFKDFASMFGGMVDPEE